MKTHRPATETEFRPMCSSRLCVPPPRRAVCGGVGGGGFGLSVGSEGRECRAGIPAGNPEGRRGQSVILAPRAGQHGPVEA